jgi:hypothetical protein
VFGADTGVFTEQWSRKDLDLLLDAEIESVTVTNAETLDNSEVSAFL